MGSLSQQNAYRLAVLIIGLTWLWQILNVLFPLVPVFNFYLPKISLMEDFPLAALYAVVKGIGYLLLLLWLLRFAGERLVNVGFHREQLFRQLAIGALFGILIFIFNSALLLPFIETLFPTFHVSNSALFSTKFKIGLLFFLGIVKGGFLEECWRIFVLTRFEKVFQRTGLAAALIFSSIVFGLGHAYQGNSAIIGTAVIGLLNGLVYLRKRNAFEAVAAHAIFDILAVAGGALMSSGH
jgi:uncharacterized protein